MCDALERATGTNPYDADTDGDGIPDGEEDLNRDGRVDPGETDPRSPGLFPGAAPHIPEPLLFDLVRSLGARGGELEVNTLVVTTFDRRGKPVVHWAPEIEWAIIDGLAVEAELPLENAELIAFKGAAQVTLPGRTANFIHGIQGIGEYFPDEEVFEGSLLYLIGTRTAAWSLFTMLGGRHAFGEPLDSSEFLLNPSIFYDVVEELTFGVETILSLGLEHRQAIVLPQAHYQVSKRFRFQVGAGLHATSERVGPLFGTRLVLE